MSKEKPDTSIRLNKFLAHAGLGSRKDADRLIRKDFVKVNGKLVNELGASIQKSDKVTVKGKLITPKDLYQYVLLNKSKDTHTHKRVNDINISTVFRAVTEKSVTAVDELTETDLGLVIFTNDKGLLQKMQGKNYKIKQVFQVFLDRDLEGKDFNAIKAGVEVDGETIIVSEVNYVDADNKSAIGIQLASRDNLKVKSIFKTLGYTIERLDRVIYGGFSKKDIPRGKSRALTEKEVIFLKHF